MGPVPFLLLGCALVASAAGAPAFPGYTSPRAANSGFSRFRNCPWNYEHLCRRWWWRVRHRDCCRGTYGLNEPHQLWVSGSETAWLRFDVPAGEATHKATARLFVESSSHPHAAFELRVVDDHDGFGPRSVAHPRSGPRGAVACSLAALPAAGAVECDVTKLINDRRKKDSAGWIAFELYATAHRVGVSSSRSARVERRPQLIVENMGSWHIPPQYWVNGYDDTYVESGQYAGHAMWRDAYSLQATGGANTLMRFRVPNWGVASGKTELVVFPITMRGPIEVRALNAAKSGNWQFKSVTWNNAPRGNAADAEVVCTIPPTAEDQPARCDMTEYVEKLERSWGFEGGVIELRIDGGHATFHSSRHENAALRPRIEMVYKFE